MEVRFNKEIFRLVGSSYANELVLCCSLVSLCEGFALSTELWQGLTVVLENHVLVGKAVSTGAHGGAFTRALGSPIECYPESFSFLYFVEQ